MEANINLIEFYEDISGGNCFLTVGLICGLKRKEEEKGSEDEKIIVGCKVSIKENITI